jgi:secondary thiamine-phosphate synthase enzyme
MIYHQSFKVKNTSHKPIFHDVTEHVRKIVAESGVKNGIIVVYSQHTTCSIIIQEDSHDTTFDGTKYMMQDLLDVLEKIIPQCRKEGQYMHPGPKHIKHATENLNEQSTWSLNTDAHLRSVIIGRSETIPIVNSMMELGEFGLIYLVDFDSVRQRERIVNIQIVGE